MGRVEGRAADRTISDRDQAIAIEVVAIAEEIGCTPSQVAIHWVHRQPGVIIPLLGARDVAQLKDNLGALEIMLSEDQLERLEEASAIELGFPHDFLNASYVKTLVFGGTDDQIVRHR